MVPTKPGTAVTKLYPLPSVVQLVLSFDASNRKTVFALKWVFAFI